MISAGTSHQNIPHRLFAFASGRGHVTSSTGDTADAEACESFSANHMMLGDTYLRHRQSTQESLDMLSSRTCIIPMKHLAFLAYPLCNLGDTFAPRHCDFNVKGTPSWWHHGKGACTCRDTQEWIPHQNVTLLHIHASRWREKSITLTTNTCVKMKSTSTQHASWQNLSLTSSYAAPMQYSVLRDVSCSVSVCKPDLPMCPCFFGLAGGVSFVRAGQQRLEWRSQHVNLDHSLDISRGLLLELIFLQKCYAALSHTIADIVWHLQEALLEEHWFDLTRRRTWKTPRNTDNCQGLNVPADCLEAS